jgi:hypothetical protein
MTLLDECIEALGSKVIVYDKKLSSEISHELQTLVSFTNWGRIDSDKLIKIYQIESIDDLLRIVSEKNICNSEFYIMWNDASCPVIKAELSIIIDKIDDVTAVSFDTWLFNFENRYVVEFYHEGDISIFQY